MRFRPSAITVWVGAALVVFAMASLVLQVFIFVVLIELTLLVMFALVDLYWAKRRFEHVVIQRDAPQIVGRDVPFELSYKIENSGRKRVIDAQLRDESPSAGKPELIARSVTIEPGDSETLSVNCRIPSRGLHTYGPIWLRLAGPLGLIEAQRQVDCPGSIKVLPETFASRDQLKKDWGAEIRLLDKAVRTRHQGVGTEFESLYPYRFGDDPRRIDWRATARSRIPIVRRHQIERHRDVMVIIDSGRLMGADAGRGSKLDCAVDAALMLSRVALQSGDRCGVGVFDREVRGFLPPISGATAMQALVRCIYDLQSEYHESDFSRMLTTLQARQSKRTFLVVLSDVSDAETSKRMCAALGQLGRRHLVLFAALRTPLYEQILGEPLDDFDNAARKAVVFRLLRDRGRALFALRRGGVHVMDVEPDRLTMPLVNQFIELRQRNLL